jgi:thymidylate kinase
MDMQKYLPRPTLTIFLDIAPETAVSRKALDRDRYERDLAMQGRVRDSYRRLAQNEDWIRVDGERPKDTIAADVAQVLMDRLLQ